jgi:hypothetical protein
MFLHIREAHSWLKYTAAMGVSANVGPQSLRFGRDDNITQINTDSSIKTDKFLFPLCALCGKNSVFCAAGVGCVKKSVEIRVIRGYNGGINQ